MVNEQGPAGERGATGYDASKLDQRVDMQLRYVRALEALGASTALLAAVALLDGIVAERNALIRSELARSPGLAPAA